MNEQGLWYGSTSLYDGAALPVRTDIKKYYHKPVWTYELPVKVIEECTTVDEAIAIYSTYFSPYWTGHTLLVDKQGNSVIVEFGAKDVVFIHRKNHYQVMTNFPNADTLNARWYNRYRYNTASKMLASCEAISVDFFELVCDAIHREGSSPTSLSTVYDVVNANLSVFYVYNFDESLKFNLKEELQKGENYYRLWNYYNQIALKSPIDGEKVNSSSVTFIWNGNAESYQLYYSNDPDFTDIKPIEVTDSRSEQEKPVSYAAGWFAALLFGNILIRKKKALAAIISMTLMILLFSCDIQLVDPAIVSPFVPSTIEHHQTVENLQPNTLYYWKIVAVGTHGINSESRVQTFKTRN